MVFSANQSHHEDIQNPENSTRQILNLNKCSFTCGCFVFIRISPSFGKKVKAVPFLA